MCRHKTHSGRQGWTCAITGAEITLDHYSFGLHPACPNWKLPGVKREKKSNQAQELF